MNGGFSKKALCSSAERVVKKTEINVLCCKITLSGRLHPAIYMRFRGGKIQGTKKAQADSGNLSRRLGDDEFNIRVSKRSSVRGSNLDAVSGSSAYLG
jgi:hypothetical protein